MVSKFLALLPACIAAALLGGCYANNGTGSSATTAAIKAAPAISLAISPLAIRPGQTAVATWDTSNATACQAEGAWGGTVALSNHTGVTIGPFTTPGTYSFSVSCTGPGGSGTTTTIITVGAVPAPTVTLNIVPSTIAPGSSAWITWSTSNATACAGSAGAPTPGWQGSQPTSDSAGFSTGPVSTSGEYEYDLTCTGSGGSTEVTRVLNVSAEAPPAPPTIYFAAQPTQVAPGQSTTLSWTVTGANTCTASGGSGSDDWQGAKPLSSTGTSSGSLDTVGSYAFTLTCTGAGGTTAKSVTVAVSESPKPAAVSVNIAVTPSEIASGGVGYLTWSTANADACVASGSWSGVEPVLGIALDTGVLALPGVYSYTLTCTGAGGSASGTAMLTVGSPPAAVSTFSATPAAIETGQSITLAWSTQNATACTGTGGTGSDGWSHSQATSNTGLELGPIDSAGVFVYSLDCTGPGGTGAPKSAIVTVTPAIPAPPTITAFAALPSSILVGQAATLDWVTVGATACTASGGTGSDGWHGSVGTESVATSTGAITTAGVYTYTLTCSGAGGTGVPSSVIVNVNNPPGTAASIVAFAVTPSTIETGESALLTWVTAAATSCTASGGTGSWAGPVATSSVGTSTGTINTANSYTYTLSCTGPGGAGTPSSVILNVTSAPPPIPTISVFAAAPNTVQAGDSTTLTWAAVGATSCTASGGTGSDGWSGGIAIAGTQIVGPLDTAGSYTYTLTCNGPGGTSTPTSVTVDVDSTPPAPTILSFSVTPSTVQVGGSATASWSTLAATGCTATGGTPADGWSGSVPAQSSGTAIGPIDTAGLALYVLTCTGAGGTSLPSTASVLVTQSAPPAAVSSFTATPSAIQVGQSVELSWTTSNATACTASGGPATGPWSGAMPTSSTGTSSGAIAAAGIYTYVLTCSGAGGTSLPAASIVTVTATPPPVSIESFSATPSVLQTGQSTELAWSTTGASACTAGGGTGSDGWGGTVAASSSGVAVGPFNAIGVYVYSLICTGPGGISTPSSLIVTAQQAAPAASIGSFTATPDLVQAGQSTSLAWSTSNATSCLAGGGTGSDGWSGTLGTSSSGRAVGPLNAGTITYTLTCSGPGGSSAPSSLNVTVEPSVPPAPTVTLAANGANPITVQPGAALTLSWSSSNATSCSASGGAGTGGWSGSEPTSSAGVAVGAITTPGIYTYTLTCAGAGGTSGASVQVTVMSSHSFDCGIPGLATASLITPAASVSTSTSGLCVLDCTLTGAANVIDSSPSTYANISIPLAIVGSASLEVTDGATFPAGRTAGFVLANGDSLLDAALLQGITVKTYLNGSSQETIAGSLLSLQAAGLLAVDQYAGFVGFKTTKQFNAVQLLASSLVALDSNLRVYSACVSQQ